MPVTHMVEDLSEIGKAAHTNGVQETVTTLKTIEKDASIVAKEGSLAQAMQHVGESQKTGKGLIGKAYEDFLVRKLGGKGSFKVGGREFDGAVGNVWYEAKSGQYWNFVLSSKQNLSKFKSDMGDRLKIALANKATYELHSNTPIPQEIKDWLTQKNIPFHES